MADLQISQLPALAEADLAAVDELAIVDDSASETKRITAKALVEKGVALIDAGSIPGTALASLGTGTVNTAAIATDAVTADKILAGAVGASEIANGSITATEIAANTLTANEIAPNAIGASELADNAVDTNAIGDLAVTNQKIANGTIAYAKLNLSNADIPGAKIADNSITAGQIAPDAVGASELANNAVDTNAIANLAVTSGKLAANSVTVDKIVDGVITGAKLATGTITATQIGANAVGASELANDAVDTNAILDDAVTAAKIAAGAVDTTALGAAAVTGAKIANTTITAANIVAGTITATELAADSVGASEIAANAVGASELADDAVDTNAIANLAVTGAKIANTTIAYAKLNLSDGDIPAAKITANSLTADQIAANAIGASELANNSVDTAAIADDAVTGAKIAAATITGANIAATTIAAGNIVANTLTANEIAPNAIGASELADDAVDTAAIADSAVTNAKIANTTIAYAKLNLSDGDIAGAKITNNSLTANQIAANAIGASELANDAVDTNAIADDAVTGAKIAAGTITAANIAADTITATQLAADSVGASEIVANAVGASELADNAVDTAAIANSAVTGAKIAASTITAAKLNLSAGDIDGTKIANNSITANQIAANAITASELADDAVDTAAIANNSVTAAKIATNAVTATELANNAVDTAAVADGAITTAKIADGAVTTAKLSGTIEAGTLADGSVITAKLADDAVTAAKLGAGAVDTLALGATSVTTAKIAAGAVTDAKVASGISGAKLTDGTVTAAKFLTTDIDRSLNISSGKLGINNTISAGTSAGISYNAQGLITATTALVASDLPVATATAVGGVSVPTSGGLTVSGTGALSIAATTTGATATKVTFNNFGQITGTATLAASDLPKATASAVGAVSVPTGGPLSIDSNGAITVANSGVTAGTGTKVTVDAKGRVTNLATLTSSDLPNHSAALITSGTISTARIANDAVTGTKLANASTTLFGSVAQTGFPTSEFTGQFFFDSVSEDLYIYDGNAYQPVTTLTKGSLVFGGTFNAATSKVASVTTAGAAGGLTVGSNVPTPTSSTDGLYLVVENAGTPSAPAPVVALAPPDYILGVTNTSGSSWEEIDLSQTVAGQVASNITFTPYGQISSTNVQDAIQELETEKLAKAGGTVTGEVLIGNTGTLVFEGSSIDAFQTTLGVVNPTTADKTILLPNTSGTLITNNDSGTITSAMIADGTIVNADINASAAIALTKLEGIDSGKIIVGNGSGVAAEVAVTGDIAITNAGVTSISAGAIVNADISNSAAITGSKVTTGTTSAVGVLQLTDSATSTSTTTAATPAAVKIAKDAADAAAVTANAALPKAGGSLSDNLIIDNAKSIRLSEADSNGSHYIALKAPNAVTADITFTLPDGDGSSGQRLQTDGSGNLSWGTDNSTDPTKLPLAGGTMSGAIAMGTSKITGLGNPTAAQDAATKTYVDAASTTGNAATATALATARTIGGVSFDGSANIDLPGVNTAGNQSTTGNAATATKFASAVTIGGVSFDGSANINLPGVNAAGTQDTSGTAALATQFTVTANNSTDEDVYPVFVDAATGSQGAETDSALTYNPSTGALTTTVFIGNVTGNVTGNTSGSSGSCTGNAATATKFASSVTIGGVAFDGSANINLPGVNASGTQDTSGTAAVATAITVADESTDTSCNVLFTTAATGNLGAKSGTNLTFNSNTGELAATLFSGSGASLTTLNASNISSGTLAAARVATLNQDTTGTAALATSFTVTANNSTDETVYLLFADGATGSQGAETDTGLTYNPSTGLLTSTGFSGVGTSLTALNASNLASGTVATARLGSGTASSSNFLRGDNTWQTIDLTALSASNLTSGTVPDARFPATLPAASGANLTALNASNLSSGTVNVARLGSGSSVTTKFLRGDNTWQTISATPEGTAILSTGESGGTKFLREDGDGTCSWQSVPAAVTINNQADNRIVTATGTTNTLNGEASLTFDGTNLDLGDDKKIRLGDSAELSLYTRGSDSNSVIEESGSGVLFVSAPFVRITNSGLSTSAALFQTAGSCELSYAGTKKIETTSSGVAVTGALTISGDLTVNGTTTTIDTTTLQVEDKNIEIGKVSSPSDSTADGGGITLLGATNKTWNWVNSTDAWTSSEHIQVASGKTFIGDGSTLTALNASNLASGTVAPARLGSGSASQYNFLRGDGSWQEVMTLGGGNFNSGADVKFQGSASNKDLEWDASAYSLIFNDDVKAVFGTSSDGLEIFHNASDSVINDNGTGSLKLQLGGSTKAEVVSGGFTVTGTATATTFSGSGASLSNLNADNISSGTVPTARLGSGTASSSNFLRGDGSWQTIDVSAYAPLAGATFTGDVQFNGDNYNLLWDKSDNALELAQQATLKIGSYTITENSGGYLQFDSNSAAGSTYFKDDTQFNINSAVIKFENYASNQDYFKATSSAVELYASGTKRLHTNSNGVYITGSCYASGGFSGSGANLTNLPGVTSDAQKNTVGGTNAGDSFSGTSAEYNTLFGYDTGTAITTGDKNTAFGYRAMYHINTGSDNTYMGFEAGEGGQDRNKNTYIGSYAGKNNSTGFNNTAIGYSALGQSGTGGGNVCVGYEAGTAVGGDGSENVILGMSAGSLGGNYSIRNVAIGSQAIGAGNGAVKENVAIGYKTLYGGSGGITGDRNIAIGFEAGKTVTSGEKNIAIGTGAGGALGSNSGNIFIGDSAGYSAGSAADSICIGNSADPNDGTDNIAIGHNAVNEQFSSHQITLGHTNITSFRIPGIDFYLKDNGGTPSQGQVLTADANGKGYWADTSGGVSGEFTATADGAITANDPVSIMGDGKLKKCGEVTFDADWTMGSTTTLDSTKKWEYSAGAPDPHKTNRFAITFTDDNSDKYVYLQIYTISGSTITKSGLHPVYNSAGNNSHPCCVFDHEAEGRVLVIWQNTSGYRKATLVNFTGDAGSESFSNVSGSTNVSFGSHNNHVGNQNVTGNQPQQIRYYGDKSYLEIYQRSYQSTSYYMTFTINGDSINTVQGGQFWAEASKSPAAFDLDPSNLKKGCATIARTSNKYWYMRTFTINSNDTVTTDSENSVIGSYSTSTRVNTEYGYNHLHYVGPGQFIVGAVTTNDSFWSGGSKGYQPVFKLIKVSGSTFTRSTNYFMPTDYVGTPTHNNEPIRFLLTNNKDNRTTLSCVTRFSGSNANIAAFRIDCDLTNNTVTGATSSSGYYTIDNTQTQVVAGGYMQFGTLMMGSDSDRTTFLMYNDYGNNTYGRVMTPGGPGNNLNSYLGLATATVSDGNSATVKTVGNTATSSGLSTGKRYYVQLDGTLGTSPATTEVTAGIALSATSLLVK